MAESIECTQCGIRYSDALETCPWCGAGDAVSPDQPAPTPAPPRAEEGGDATPPPVPESAPEPAQPPLQFTEEPASPAAMPREGAPKPADPGATVIASTRPPPEKPPPDPAATVAAPPPAAPPPAAPPPAAPPSTPTYRVTAPEAPTPAPPPPPPRRTPPPPPPAPPLPRPAGPGPLAYRLRRIALGAVGVVVLLAIGALIAEFAPLGPLASNGDSDVTPTPSAESTAAPVTSTAEPTEPTEPPTTTSAPATTPPPPPATLPPIDPVGEPIPLPELALGVNGIGPLEFGADGTEILGRLAATFGQPEENTGLIISTGEFGTCAGDQVRIARFGSLGAVTVVDPASGLEVFRSYRVDLTYQEAPSDADGLTTISGMRAGDTLATVRDIYAGFDVRTVEGAAGAVFELRSGSGTLLLFGPVTATGDDGVVTGIYSPDPCAS